MYSKVGCKGSHQILLYLKGYGNIYFLLGFSIRIFKAIVISVIKFCVTCLVSEILNDKWHWPSAIFFYDWVYFNDVTSRVDNLRRKYIHTNPVVIGFQHWTYLLIASKRKNNPLLVASRIFKYPSWTFYRAQLGLTYLSHTFQFDLFSRHIPVLLLPGTVQFTISREHFIMTILLGPLQIDLFSRHLLLWPFHQPYFILTFLLGNFQIDLLPGHISVLPFYLAHFCLIFLFHRVALPYDIKE